MPRAEPRLTPMLRQYLEVKAQHEDAILFYRMGDFFELFYEDARRAAPIMEVALTARHKGSAHEAPMCGVPYHALENYLGKLLRAGLKVAICDQVEDPAQAKGLVRREVTRVVTPGTVSSPELLEGKEENLLASISWDGERGAGAFLDVSTGSFFARRWRNAEEAREELEVLRPRELLHVPGDELPDSILSWAENEVSCLSPLDEGQQLTARLAAELLTHQLGASTLRGFGLEQGEPAVLAAAHALAYARDTQHSELSHVRQLRLSESRDWMVLDATTLSNLEVFRNQREGGRNGTLLSVLDRTVSPAGGRLLRDWLRRPLKEREQIVARHEAVEELAADGRGREEMREGLAQLGDPERLLARAVLGTLGPREAASLRDGLAQVPRLLDLSARYQATLLSEVAAVDPLQELAAELARTLMETPAANLKQGGVIAEGVDEELDRCRSLAHDSKRHILELEARERESTGIQSLKIRYNKVFGYYVEVTKANQHLVPEHYIRKQTLVNAERYITPEIKELEEQVLGAEERQLALEAEHFEQLQSRVAAEGAGLAELSQALGALDVLANFADVAMRRSYCRPAIGEAGEDISVTGGRHPVVEAAINDPFVPNDAQLDGKEAQIVVLTGPNMGGKSTYLRQVALIVLMAQVGSYVPAESASIGPCDRVFTRVGASDNLARGESTFMVEMIETANILHHASEQSLVILDEVGRGTATFDGLSLAWAIVEFLQAHRRPKTLFATHYHELTELATRLAGVVNRTMAVREWEDRIVFLRRVVAGSADKSYGLHVARLAGLPASVIERAGEVLANLEQQHTAPEAEAGSVLSRPSSESPTETAPATGYEKQQETSSESEAKAKQGAVGKEQLPLFTPAEEVVAELLREVDVDQLTPLAALNLVASLQQRLG